MLWTTHDCSCLYQSDRRQYLCVSGSVAQSHSRTHQVAAAQKAPLGASLLNRFDQPLMWLRWSSDDDDDDDDDKHAVIVKGKGRHIDLDRLIVKTRRSL